MEPQERQTITWMGRRACGVRLFPQLAYSLAEGYGSYRVDNNIQLFSSVHPLNITQMEMRCIMDTSAGMYQMRLTDIRLPSACSMSS